MQKTVMISSTSLDLPEHRKQVMDACLRADYFPKAMEHLPARDADAITVSMEMVDKADIYVGIFAWRYGHVPEGYDISITEMEFNRALKRKIPIVVFLIHDDHPITRKMVETNDAAQAKLEALKIRASKGATGDVARRQLDAREFARADGIVASHAGCAPVGDPQAPGCVRGHAVRETIAGSEL